MATRRVYQFDNVTEAYSDWANRVFGPKCRIGQIERLRWTRILIIEKFVLGTFGVEPSTIQYTVMERDVHPDDVAEMARGSRYPDFDYENCETYEEAAATAMRMEALAAENAGAFSPWIRRR